MRIGGNNPVPQQPLRVSPDVGDRTIVTQGGVKIYGRSASGLGTTIYIQKEHDSINNTEGFEIAVDAGSFWKTLVATKDLWITHEHPDHVQDLVKWLNYRAILRDRKEQPNMAIYAQPNIAKWLSDTYENYILTKGHVENVAVVDYTHQQPHLIGPYKIPFYNRFLIPFQTDHTVPTYGFKIQNADGTGVLAYIPDTTKEVFNKDPDLQSNYPLLIMEATLSEDLKDIYKAAKHMSFDEAAYFADMSTAKDIVFTHISPLSSTREMDKIIENLSENGKRIHKL